MKTRVIQDQPDDDRPPGVDAPGRGEPDTPTPDGDEPPEPARTDVRPQGSGTTIRPC